MRRERMATLTPHLAGWLGHEHAVDFLLRGPGHLNYDAPLRTDAEVFTVGRNRFRFLVASHPDFALEVMATMASRLRAGNLRG